MIVHKKKLCTIPSHSLNKHDTIQQQDLEADHLKQQHAREKQVIKF